LNRAKRDRTTVNVENDAEIEAILSSEEEIMPSSGFLASVIDRVHQEAALPPPIPFPWKQAIAGVLFVTGVSAWGVVELVRLGLPVMKSLPATQLYASASFVRPIEVAGWLSLALGISLVSVIFSRQLAGRGGLL